MAPSSSQGRYARSYALAFSQRPLQIHCHPTPTTSESGDHVETETCNCRDCGGLCPLTCQVFFVHKELLDLLSDKGEIPLLRGAAPGERIYFTTEVEAVVMRRIVTFAYSKEFPVAVWEETGYESSDDEEEDGADEAGKRRRVSATAGGKTKRRRILPDGTSIKEETPELALDSFETPEDPHLAAAIEDRRFQLAIQFGEDPYPPATLSPLDRLSSFTPHNLSHLHLNPPLAPALDPHPALTLTTSVRIYIGALSFGADILAKYIYNHLLTLLLHLQKHPVQIRRLRSTILSCAHTLFTDLAPSRPDDALLEVFLVFLCWCSKELRQDEGWERLMRTGTFAVQMVQLLARRAEEAQEVVERRGREVVVLEEDTIVCSPAPEGRAATARETGTPRAEMAAVVVATPRAAPATVETPNAASAAAKKKPGRPKGSVARKKAAPAPAQAAPATSGTGSPAAVPKRRGRPPKNAAPAPAPAAAAAAAVDA